MPAPTPETLPAERAQNAAVRRFGRLQLLRLLGKSERTMAWRVADPRTDHELMLVLPRVQPADAAALARWQQALARAARRGRAQLAAVVETGVQDGWPYVAHDPRGAATLAETLPAKGLPAVDAVALATQLLRGLAFAHDAGVAHHDLEPWLLLVGDNGALRVAGMAVACETAPLAHAAAATIGDTLALAQQREAAERDVVGAGLLVHQMLTGAPALDEPDLARAIARLAPWAGPHGREFVRLPFAVAHPVPEALRAIVNRCTDRQPRQRYRNARTLLGALEGWQQTESGAGGGPLVLLADRLRTAGVLPASPGAGQRAARLAMMETERMMELASVVLEDLALSFEMLRVVNTAQVRGAQVSGSGPVLTVRRAIAMMGLDGVRRAALALREWPGPLDEAGAAELERVADRCKRAGRVAMTLRPPAYDGEVVYLLALLQNLGRLVVQYHFADEAVQIRRLMQPAAPQREGEAEEPGMTEEAASFAVLGADIEAIGAAVARHWGLDDGVLAMIRRHALATPVRTPDSDDELLRTVASCANEAVDALSLPAPRIAAALQRVVQRYGRALSFGVRELQAALAGKPLQPEAQASNLAPLNSRFG